MSSKPPGSNFHISSAASPTYSVEPRHQSIVNSIAYHRYIVLAQHALLICDYSLILWSESDRHSIYAVGGGYIFQCLFILASVILLLTSIASSYPFKHGLISVIFAEFRLTLWTALLYLAVCVAVRIIMILQIYKCRDQKCELYTVSVTIAYFIMRFCSIGYYYAIHRSCIQLCHPKYYTHSEWFKRSVKSYSAARR
ncbi:transmembrane protein 138-domain-containing protein [Paraphysoderma sedebokerense]|nr:transmembrane protein 138-domain-containing protein [Paraphysoderma sedebokerense]